MTTHAPTPSPLTRKKPGILSSNTASGKKPSPHTPTPTPLSAKKPKPTSRKKEWDATTQDLTALKLSPLQQKLRAANSLKYTHSHRLFAPTTTRYTFEPIDSDPNHKSSPYHADDIELQPVSSRRHSDENTDFAENKDPTTPLNVTQTKHEEVDFETEVQVWERTHRALAEHKPSRSAGTRKVLAATTDRPSAAELNRHGSQNRNRSAPRARKSPPHEIHIPLQHLRQATLGMRHLAESLSAQIGEPFAGGDDIHDDVSDHDEENRSGDDENATVPKLAEALALVRDVSSRATRYIEKLQQTNDMQTDAIHTLQARCQALEARITALEKSATETHTTTTELHQQLNEERGRRERDVGRLEELVGVVVAAEEGRAADWAVRQVLGGV
ncbi:uncharacterized protein EV422DRAFT_203496 [Fimicolochytrium jonesii]|uniref:uncharacterized protein n=1 Tax=Fimicolochytrium jonesii TaxID=1396493 RepID=UPI0022FDD59F|nr:uncharacterized protein EV422DRAFT_203496 [Fimicolochytrium jonesii]KAI8818039.1 hypothetical protein EV422DRAFT_203496 [Fimicolochytrium jonesii]